MDYGQIADIIIREHQLVSHDTRQYIQTQIDRSTEGQTIAARARVLELLQRAEAHQDVLEDEDLAALRVSCAQMVDALDSYAKDQRDAPVEMPDSVVTRVPTRGRPRKHIDEHWLATASHFRGPKGIAQYLPDVHPRTVRRAQLRAGIRSPQPPVMIYTAGGPPQRNVHSNSRLPTAARSAAELDANVARLVNQFQNHGRSLMEGQVLALGMELGADVSRSEIAASMRRVSGLPAQFGRRPIVRRKYRVGGPGSLWHHDGQHGLIHWKMVTHAFVDGYSRRVMALRTSNNNRGTTVLELYLNAASVWGFPSRVRGDHGVENLLVAAVQEEVRGPNRGSYIWGKSTHNTRVERMWVDVVVGYVNKWKTFFLDLEENHGLQRNDECHIWLLQFLYLDCINADGVEWARGWNEHHFTRLPPHQHVRGSHLPSPNELYFFGEHVNGVRSLNFDTAVDALEDDEAIANYGAADDHDDDEDRTVRRFQHEEQLEGVAHGHDIPEADLHQNGWSRPRRMFEVRVPPPTAPFNDDVVDGLREHLTYCVDLTAETMSLRRLWWAAALDYVSGL